ncbi:dnaJ-like protein 60 [Hyalella azteca]|uniref:DnaJ-like protein 60 n=1 Tax=Hyalella azteca TaxID=294128 RepID=A0A8B7N163_HYAAZ|nr:dnaJ-like protein 60 [Hyalella azteca]
MLSQLAYSAVGKHQRLARFFYQQLAYFSISPYRSLTHYELLGLQKDCSQTDVRDAFVRLSKEWHPDKQSQDVAESQHNKFIELNTAYSVLSKPQSRAFYDAQLRASERGYYEVYGSYRVYTDAPKERVVHRHPSSYENHEGGNDTGRGYYGLSFIKEKLPNSTVVSIVLAFFFVGCVAHFYIAQVTSNYYKNAAERRSRVLAQSYSEVRKRALDSDRHAQLRDFQQELDQQTGTSLSNEQMHLRNKKFLQSLTETAT